MKKLRLQFDVDPRVIKKNQKAIDRLFNVKLIEMKYTYIIQTTNQRNQSYSHSTMFLIKVPSRYKYSVVL